MKVYETIEDFLECVDNDWLEKRCPIYMTSGGFDPLHIGHLRCILDTTSMADKDGGYVVVIVNGDGFLDRKKGFAFMPEKERAEMEERISFFERELNLNPFSWKRKKK